MHMCLPALAPQATGYFAVSQTFSCRLMKLGVCYTNTFSTHTVKLACIYWPHQSAHHCKATQWQQHANSINVTECFKFVISGYTFEAATCFFNYEPDYA